MNRHEPDIRRPTARNPRAEPSSRKLEADPVTAILRRPRRIHPF